jgi:hypothetical protein
MKKTAKYHHEQGHALMYELLEDMEKSAVDLSQLTRAYRATVKPNVFKATRGQTKATKRLSELIKRRGASYEVVKNLNQANIGAAIPKETINALKQDVNLVRESVKNQVGAYLKPAELEAAQRISIGQANSMSSRGVISMPGDQSKAIRQYSAMYVPSNLSGESKNMINKITGLHEAAELKAIDKQIRSGKVYAGPSFQTHAGPNPMLNDVNIANTLTGPGSREAREFYMRMRRPELRDLRNMLAGDPRAEALIDKMLGGGRISRHGRKYLTQAHTNYFDKLQAMAKQEAEYFEYLTRAKPKKAPKKTGILGRLKKWFS